ncbi:Uncharacterised protein [Mycobacterium tuberculosis]|nr:Uncharacterised protein [Mycobacterium tuberculosis]
MAVFQAKEGVIGVPGLCRCSGSLPWTSCSTKRNTTLTAEKANTLRAYVFQVCSASGLAPISR